MLNSHNCAEIELVWADGLGTPWVTLRVTSTKTLTAGDLHSLAEAVEAIELFRETEGAEQAEPIGAS